MSAIVVYCWQCLLHALSRDIFNGFHFSNLELMLVPVLDFIYTICRLHPYGVAYDSSELGGRAMPRVYLFAVKNT